MSPHPPEPWSSPAAGPAARAQAAAGAQGVKHPRLAHTGDVTATRAGAGGVMVVFVVRSALAQGSRRFPTLRSTRRHRPPPSAPSDTVRDRTRGPPGLRPVGWGGGVCSSRWLCPPGTQTRVRAPLSLCTPEPGAPSAGRMGMRGGCSSTPRDDAATPGGTWVGAGAWPGAAARLLR